MHVHMLHNITTAVLLPNNSVTYAVLTDVTVERDQMHEFF